jgi:hypothetical protein
VPAERRGAIFVAACTKLGRQRFANSGDQLMKKKIHKPLKLNRETLTSLDHGDLREPVGMALTQFPNGCTRTTDATAVTCAVINTLCVGW